MTENAKLRNEDRASYGRVALCAYANDRNDENPNTASDEDLIDLLTDLRHLCDEYKIDFHRLIATSQMHHSEEVEEAEADDEA